MKAAKDTAGAPRQPGRFGSIVLALAVHAAFFALIVFGVSWQSRPMPPLQAELWDKLPPGPPVTKPRVEPEPAPEPPKPAQEPPKPAPPLPRADAKPEPPKPDPEIAERKERERKARAKKEQEAREKLEREKVEREKRERLERQKKEEEQRRKREAEEVERKKREAKAAAEAKVAAEAKAAAEAAAQQRLSEIDRYRGRIRDKIRGKANVPDTVRGRPEVQVRITILPGGDVLDISIVKSSGNRVYDTAIERAIRSAQPLPVPSNPELFGQFRSLILNIQHDR